MRTTIRLDEHLLREVKQEAAKSGRTLTAVIETALREMLAKRRVSRRTKLRLTTFRGKGLQPGVDLDDSSSLLDLMDNRR